MSMDEINKQVEAARKLVNTWPEWKRNILVQSGLATVSTPRTPVNNSDSKREGRRQSDSVLFI